MRPIIRLIRIPPAGNAVGCGILKIRRMVIFAQDLLDLIRVSLVRAASRPIQSTSHIFDAGHELVRVSEY